jgi:hypothetical protein
MNLILTLNPYPATLQVPDIWVSVGLQLRPPLERP